MFNCCDEISIVHIVVSIAILCLCFHTTFLYVCWLYRAIRHIAHYIMCGTTDVPYQYSRTRYLAEYLCAAKQFEIKCLRQKSLNLLQSISKGKFDEIFLLHYILLKR